MVPPILYKYTSSSTALLILEGGKLRWSSPTLFNDLAEFQRMPRFEPTLAEASRLLPQVLMDAVHGITTLDKQRLAATTQLLLALVQRCIAAGFDNEELLSALYEARPDADARMDQVLREHFRSLDLDRARILCVTTAVDNEVMWGTYADSHTGCVLGLTHVPELSTPLLAAREVKYSELAPVVGSGVDFLLYGDTPDLRTRTTDAVCFTKKASWSYEQEWRALTWRWEETDVAMNHYKFYPEELESVTFGARTSGETVRRIRDVVRQNYPRAALFRMVQDREHLRRLPAGDA